MYHHLQAFCEASSGFKLQLFAFKIFHSLKRVAWLAGHVKSMPKTYPSCLQPALANGCPYAGPSNPFFSLLLLLLWKPLRKLKLPIRHQERSSACSYQAILTFFHLVLPFYPLLSALLSEQLLSEQSRMFCKAWKYKLGKSDMNSLAGTVSWDISDLGVVPHGNESTRLFGFVILI